MGNCCPGNCWPGPDKEMEEAIFKADALANKGREIGLPYIMDPNLAPLGLRTEFGYSKDFRRKYKLGKLLGHGHFGYTYSAVKLSTGMNVAVKTIQKKQEQQPKVELVTLEGGTVVAFGGANNGMISWSREDGKTMILPIAVEHVKREVKVMQTLSGHENIVEFYEAFEDEKLIYIVMELCEGGELLDRVLSKRKKSGYSEKEAARIVREMLRVVAHCHLNGVVHRDIKPENFLLKSHSDDSPIKAADFGLSNYIKPGKRFCDAVGSSHYIAPEVLRKKSGPESDVWSVGVVAYILLSGRRPFWHETEEGLFKQILRKNPDFSEKPWQDISASAEDFVKRLLNKNPSTRLTAAQALSHPWVKEGGDASDLPLDISVLSNMREFVKYSRLKQLAFRALATTLDEQEISNLRDQFNAIDEDKNGFITLKEMKQAFSKDRPWILKESRIWEILQAMDINSDGLVDFDEFVAATLHVHQLEGFDAEKWQSRLREAFQKFDTDKDGYISMDELKLQTGVKGCIYTLLDEGDFDKDGRISLREFQRLLKQASFGSRTNGASRRHAYIKFS